MQGKIRWSSAKVARAGAWQDWLWVGDHFEREREREREREGLREWVRQTRVMR